MKFKIEQPKIPIELLVTMSLDSLESREEISNGVIEHITIEYLDAVRVSFEKMIYPL